MGQTGMQHSHWERGRPRLREGPRSVAGEGARAPNPCLIFRLNHQSIRPARRLFA